jgi:prepilin-type N-terminal cleavage/methylation domain-containing protein
VGKKLDKQGIISMRMRFKERGFTLIEAIIVVIIIAIFAIMALPRLNSTGIQVRSVSRQIMDDMRYARTLAVTEVETHPTGVAVDFNSNTQYVIDGITKILPNEVQCAATPKTFTFNKRGDASDAVTFVVSKDSYSFTFYIKKSTGMVTENGS